MTQLNMKGEPNMQRRPEARLGSPPPRGAARSFGRGPLFGTTAAPTRDASSPADQRAFVRGHCHFQVLSLGSLVPVGHCFCFAFILPRSAANLWAPAIRGSY
ncbi:hypothetical protein MRX96_019033 [Rhipicephalus microplus]